MYIYVGGKRIALLQGPPGSGKSATIVRLMALSSSATATHRVAL